MTGLSAEEVENLSEWAVMNMLMAEYDYDVDIAVQREEEREIALQEGLSEGSYLAKLETAKLMKQAHCKLDFITRMTGLSAEEVENLSEWVGMNMLIAEICTMTGLTEAEVEKL